MAQQADFTPRLIARLTLGQGQLSSRQQLRAGRLHVRFQLLNCRNACGNGRPRMLDVIQLAVCADAYHIARSGHHILHVLAAAILQQRDTHIMHDVVLVGLALPMLHIQIGKLHQRRTACKKACLFQHQINHRNKPQRLAVA